MLSPIIALRRSTARILATMSKDEIVVVLSHDEALVLSDFFGRFQATDRLEFAHAAEFVSLGRITAQLDKSVAELFAPDYLSLLAAARVRVAGSSDTDYPGPKVAAAGKT